MKYVKLFESWLNSVNEAANLREYNLRSGEDYAKGSKSFSDYIAGLMNKMFDGKLKLTPSLSGSNITFKISGAPFSNNSTFTFKFDKIDNMQIYGIGTDDKLAFGIEGKTKGVEGGDQNQTTLAQFVYSALDGGELKPYSDQEFKKSVDDLVYFSEKGEFPKVSTPKGKKNISKMTVNEFMKLPTESKTKAFSDILGKAYSVYAPAKDTFIISLEAGFAKKNSIEFTKREPQRPDTGSYLAFRLDLGTKEYEKLQSDSVANLPVIWGPTEYNKGESFNPEDVLGSVGISKIVDQKTSTLARLLFDVKKIAESGMKTAKGEDIKSSDKFISAITADDNKDLNAKAAEAWTKKGGPADMTLRADATKETTA
jgi:hypothetical protein